jgi:hypothetical protein
MKKSSAFSIPNNITFTLAAALFTALLPTAQAQVEVSDNFNYSAGVIAPQNGNGANNGGIGWAKPNLTGDYGDSAGANPWSSAAWQNYTIMPWLPSPSQAWYNTKGTAATVVTTPTLSYTDGSGNTFNASGNTVDVGNKSAERYYSTAGISAFEAGTLGSPTTLWASFLFQPTVNPNKVFILPFGNAGDRKSVV